MATTQDAGGGGLADVVSNAREFVEEKLRDVDSPVSPAELAREYGCGNQHMQNVCSELAQEGVIERVEEGQYVDGPADGTESAESDLSEPGESGGSDSDASLAGSTGSDDDPSAGGGPQSGDSDTEEGDGPSDRDAAIAGAATAGAAAVPSALEKLDTTQIVLLLAVAVAAYMVFVRDGSDSSSEPAPSTGADREEAAGGTVGDDGHSVFG